jgi:hypothetical protein
MPPETERDVPILGAGNFWLDDADDPGAPGALNEKLLQAGDLGLGGVRVTGGWRALAGRPDYIDWGRAIIEACRGVSPSLKVLFEFHASPSEVEGEDLVQAGFDWATMARAFALPTTVTGFAVGNEADLKVQAAFEQGGEPLATTVAENLARLTREFCTGVRDAWPEVARMPGGMAQPEKVWARKALLPHVNAGDWFTGREGPPLTAINLHWYKQREDFAEVDFSTNPPSTHLTDYGGASLADRTTALLRDLFGLDPIISTMPVYISESNVARTTFQEHYPAQEWEATQAAYRAILDGLYDDVRVQCRSAHSPWYGEGHAHRADYLVSIDYPSTPGVEEVVTPVGELVSEEYAAA